MVNKSVQVESRRCVEERKQKRLASGKQDEPSVQSNDTDSKDKEKQSKPKHPETTKTGSKEKVKKPKE